LEETAYTRAAASAANVSPDEGSTTGAVTVDVRQTRSSNLNDTIAMHSKTLKFGNLCPLILRGSLD
jgi:hypothetical protein